MPREPADPFSGDAGQPGHVDDLLDAATAEAVGGRDGPEVVQSGPAGVHRACLEQDADLGQRRAVLGVAAAVDGDGAGGGSVESDDHPHGGRLAGAVGAEEAGHLARGDGEADVVDGHLVAVVLGQVAGVDHRSVLSVNG
jgi:hypothetical protein